MWSKIRDLVRSIPKNSDDSHEKLWKLPKITETPSMIIVVRAIFHDNNKYYWQVFLDESLYKL